MLRVNSSNVLVVPPFECAWLSDEARQLTNNSGRVSFEAKGENDATLIFKPKPGSRRWQHMERSSDSNVSMDHSYTIIFGSHCNTCLKIEKNSQECFKVDCPKTLDALDFVRCWVEYNKGKITLGTGLQGKGAQFSWTDPEPIEGIQHVGMGTWDSHMCFRNIEVRSLLDRSQSSSQKQDKEKREAQWRGAQPLSNLCKESIQGHISTTNVCSSLCMVDLLCPALDDIAPTLLAFLARNLEAVILDDPIGLCSLESAMLAELLGNPCLVCREKAVFDAVMHWAYGGLRQSQSDSLAQRLCNIEGLLLLIRFPLMPPEDLQAVQEHALAQKSPLLVELVAEAQQARMRNRQLLEKPSAGLAVEGKRHVKDLSILKAETGGCFQRHYSPASQNLMFVSHGDHNGVCHWLGTLYGTQEWVNPVLANSLQIQASSPNCKHTDPRAVVSGKFLRNNLAGPSRSQSGTWWLLDLGPCHRLTCNYYTLRHDASFDFPRHWVLQGTMDGSGWVDLRRHTSDNSISMPGQYASWPVQGHAASMPYRMFRILLTGPNGSQIGKRDTLHLSLLELYGHFYRCGAL